MSSKDDFEEVYLKYSDKIFRFIYLKTSDSFLAEDITGEVFVKAWKNWEKFDGEFVQAWLYKIANNVLIDYWRSKNSKNGNKNVSLEATIESGIEPSYDTDLIDQINKDDKIRKIGEALKNLTDNLKEVAILRFIEEMSAKEVAKILNITEVNVRVLQHRALVKLKEILKDEEK